MHQISLETICLLKAFQLHYCPNNSAKSMVKHFVFLLTFSVFFLQSRPCTFFFIRTSFFEQAFNVLDLNALRNLHLRTFSYLLRRKWGKMSMKKKAAGLNVLSELRSMKVEKYTYIKWDMICWTEKILNPFIYKKQLSKKSPEKNVLRFLRF